MAYTNDEKREYQNRWIQNRRNTWIEENGPCAICGGSNDLEVDHINPPDKELNPRNIWSRRQEVRDKELAKCQVLCKKCHSKKGAEEKRTSKHGTYSMRNRGCKCNKCKEYVRASKAKWRERADRN